MRYFLIILLVLFALDTAYGNKLKLKDITKMDFYPSADTQVVMQDYKKIGVDKKPETPYDLQIIKSSAGPDTAFMDR